MNRLSSFLFVVTGLTFGAAVYMIYFSKEDAPVEAGLPVKVPTSVKAAVGETRAPIPVSLPVAIAANPVTAGGSSASGGQAKNSSSEDIPVAEPDNPQTIGSRDRNRAAAAAQAAARAYYQSQQQQ